MIRRLGQISSAQSDLGPRLGAYHRGDRSRFIKNGWRPPLDRGYLTDTSPTSLVLQGSILKNRMQSRCTALQRVTRSIRVGIPLETRPRKKHRSCPQLFRYSYFPFLRAVIENDGDLTGHWKSLDAVRCQLQIATGFFPHFPSLPQRQASFISDSRARSWGDTTGGKGGRNLSTACIT